MDTIDICCCINNRKTSNPTEQKNKNSSKKRHKNYDIYNGEKVRYSKIQFSEDNDSSVLNSKRWEFVHTEECIICMKPTIVIGGIITCNNCNDTKIYAHTECANEWIKSNGLCVVCRRNTLEINV